MEPLHFCYWLQGRAELVGTPPTPEEWQSIVEHLQTVLKKVTPPIKPNGNEISIPAWHSGLGEVNIIC